MLYSELRNCYSTLGKMITTILLLLVSGLCISEAIAADNTTCNVLDYGAKADNKTDFGPALLSTYNNCIKTSTGKTLYIPPGYYLQNSSVTLTSGTNYSFRFDGTLTLAFSPGNLATGNLWYFRYNDYVNFYGNGTIFGQGDLWRPNGNLGLYSRPRLLRFENCNYLNISGITLNNSPMYHMTVIGNNNEISHVVINATFIGTTDAIDISGNNNYVHDVWVANGDECVTVKSPTNNFRAENIVCVGTAGCNIGSVSGGTAVSNVYYRNVTLSNSDSGVLIKGSSAANGYIANVTYEDFVLNAVAYPIDIDMFWLATSSNVSGTINITNITFNNFQGTEADKKRPVVKLACLAHGECSGINVLNSNITALNGATTNYYSYACGTGLDIPHCNYSTSTSSSSTTSASSSVPTSSSSSPSSSSQTSSSSPTSSSSSSPSSSSSSSSSTSPSSPSHSTTLIHTMNVSLIMSLVLLIVIWI